MSKLVFLKIRNSLYKCEVDTTNDGVVLRESENSETKSLDIEFSLRCPMHSLTMPMINLIESLLIDFVKVTEVYHMDIDSNVYKKNIKNCDMVSDIDLRTLAKSVYITNNGPDNCFVTIKECFFMISMIVNENIIQHENIMKHDTVFDEPTSPQTSPVQTTDGTKKTSTPKKITQDDELRKLKRRHYLNNKEIIRMYDEISYIKLENYEMEEEMKNIISNLYIYNDGNRNELLS